MWLKKHQGHYKAIQKKILSSLRLKRYILKNTTQLVILVRGVTDEFDMLTELKSFFRIYELSRRSDPIL